MSRSRRVVAAAASVSMALATGAAVAHADSSAILYVNNAASADCTDTGSGAGSAATPFCTIQAAANAAVAGDTVEIAAGRYAGAEITSSGTAQAPIVFQPTGNVFVQSPDTAALDFDGAAYVELEGQWVNGTTRNELTVDSAIITGGSSHITIDSAYLSAIVEIDGTASAVTISRDQLTAGVAVEAGSSNDVITTNNVGGGVGISVAGASNVAITSNTVSGGSSPYNGVGVTGGSTGISIENNIVTDPGSPSPSAEIAVDASSAPGTTLDYNVVWGALSRGNDSILTPAYSWAGNVYASAAALFQATGQGQHDLNADPDLNGAPFFETTTAPQVNSANSAAPGMLDTDMFGEPCTGNPVSSVSGAGSPDYCARGAFQGAYTVMLSMSADPAGALGVTLGSELSENLDDDAFGAALPEQLPATPAVSYSVNWGDGDTGTYSQSPTGILHTYAKPGTYTITDTADLSNGTTATQTGTVTTTATGAGSLFHNTRGSNGSWGSWGRPPAGPDLAQAAITGMPNGDAQVVAVTTGGVLEHTIYDSSNGQWQAWGIPQQNTSSVASASIAGMPDGSSQLIEVTSTGVLKHDIRNANGSWQASGWGSPAGSTGIAEASITALPDGESQLVAVTTSGTLEHNIRFANGSWQGWRALSQPGVTVTDASITGMPNGSSQIIEVTSTGVLKHDIRNADVSWQASGWGSPAGSTGISEASITALPNGSSQLVAVTTGGRLEHDLRNANGSWQTGGWGAPAQTDLVASVGDAGIAGLPNGSSQIIELSGN